MPVLITGATGLVGRALCARLVSEGQVRAYVRRDDAALRDAGVHVAVGAGDDVARLEAALTRVHTIVHLIGGLLPERGVTHDWLNRETTEAAVIAARAAGVRRFVFLSFRGADPASRNPFLSAKGRAEDHVASSDIEHVILRSPPIAEWLRERSLPAPGGAIALPDVVRALAAADGRDAPVRGTWALEPLVLAGSGSVWSRRRVPRVVADALERSAVDPAPAWTG